MQKLFSFFDYIHYRIYWFSKHKGDNAPETNGTIILTLLQCFTVIDLMVLVKVIHDYTFPNKFFYLLLAGIIGACNWYRYERIFDPQGAEGRWSQESLSQRVRKGWLLGIYMLVIFLTPPLYGYFAVNSKP
jgi:hypothetical protein